MVTYSMDKWRRWQVWETKRKGQSEWQETRESVI